MVSWDGIWCREDRCHDHEGFRTYTSLPMHWQDKSALIPITKEVLLPHNGTEQQHMLQTVMKLRLNSYRKSHCCLVFKNCHSLPSNHPYSPSATTTLTESAAIDVKAGPSLRKNKTCWSLRWELASFSNKIFLIELYAIFRHKAISQLIDYRGK